RNAALRVDEVAGGGALLHPRRVGDADLAGAAAPVVGALALAADAGAIVALATRAAAAVVAAGQAGAGGFAGRLAGAVGVAGLALVAGAAGAAAAVVAAVAAGAAGRARGREVDGGGGVVAGGARWRPPAPHQHGQTDESELQTLPSRHENLQRWRD